MHILIGFLCAFMCLCLLAIQVPAESASTGEQAADEANKSTKIDALFAPIAHVDYPGASVIVIQDGRVLHKKSYGMANLELAVPNTPQTKFRLASVTKSFTAMAIMQLDEKGLLKISDPIIKYLPDYPKGEKITIYNLLTHTSVIPDFLNYEESKKKPLEFTPGDRLNYSNTGYFVLGHIIEKVSGKSYEKYLEEEIFHPLNMLNTGCDRRNTIIKNRASGYFIDKNGDLVNAEYTDSSDEYAAGGLYSTIEDMYLWDQALYTEKLVKRASIQQAFTPVKLNDGREGNYGFGWMLSQNRGLREVGHGGDISGFNTYIARFPDQHFTVVVLSNIGMHSHGLIPTAGDLAHQIAEIYLSDKMKPKESTIEVKIDPKIYDAYVGQYRLDAPQAITDVMGSEFIITKEDNRLFGQSKLGKEHIYPESDTMFYSKSNPAKITFVKDDKGEITEVIFALMGVREFRAKRVK